MGEIIPGSGQSLLQLNKCFDSENVYYVSGTVKEHSTHLIFNPSGSSAK